MAEQQPLTLAEVTEPCHGATGEQESPVFPNLAVSEISGQRKATLVCDLLGSNGVCVADGARANHCIFLGRGVDMPATNRLSADTLEGELVYDAAQNTVEKSPLLPEGHGPVELTTLQGLIVQKIITQPGETVRTRDIHDTYEPPGAPFSYLAVNTHLQRINNKLGEPDGTFPGDRILEQTTVGYRTKIAPKGLI